jgi:hypothetical protein
MNFFRRINEGWALVEWVLVVFVLLSMVLLAGITALVRNLTRFDLQWASKLTMELEWVDPFLRVGTMWLAFLGASLAVHHRKHIHIDLFTRLAPLKTRYLMHTASGICCGIITLGLAYSFASACYVNLIERPLDYQVMVDSGQVHVCDASAAVIKEMGIERPPIFCATRKVLNAIGIPAETPGASFQIMIPVMLFVVALRFIGQGIGAGIALSQGTEAMERAEAEEEARLEAVRASVEKPHHGPPKSQVVAGGTGGRS